jgi:hypothetical protein
MIARKIINRIRGRTFRSSLWVPVVAVAALLAGPVTAQTVIEWDVISSGGGRGENADYIEIGSIGETAIGWGSNADFIVRHGFLQNHGGEPWYICGDVDANSIVNVSDIIYLIQWMFGSGPPPAVYASANVNCSDPINVSDLVYLINFVFGDGEEPCDPNGDGIPDC